MISTPLTEDLITMHTARPADWQQVKFSDLFAFQKKSPVKAGEGSKTGEFPFYTSSNTLSKYLNNALYFKEALIFGTGGNASVHYSDKPFSTSTDCVVGYPIDSNLVCPKFFFYYLSGHIQILENGFKGAGLKHISKEYIGNVELPLPPFQIQKKIVGVLDRATALCINDQVILQKYQELAQAIFIDMFGDPVNNEKGWDLQTLRNIALKISDGPFGSNLKTEHYSQKGIRVIRLKNIGVNVFKDDDTAYVSVEHYESVIKKHTCLPGDIIIGTLGEPNLRACLLPSYIDKAVNKADCVMLRVNPKICSQSFVCFLLNHPSFVYSVSNKLHGQTRTRISMGQVAELMIPVPPKHLQDKFSEIMGLLRAYQQNLKTVSNHSNQLFECLVKQAFKEKIIS